MGDNRLLKAEVDVAMQLSQFAARCYNKKLTFEFRFTLEDPEGDNLLPPSVVFVPPNRFDLIFRKLAPIIEPPAPPPPQAKTGAK
jgi:hypothetical protein